MSIYKYNISSSFIEFLDYAGGGVIGMLGILAVAPMTIIGISLDDYNETLAVVIVLSSLLNLLISIPICYSDSVAITLLSPYALIALIIIFMLDTVISISWLLILGIYLFIKWIVLGVSAIYIPIRWVASGIYDIYSKIASGIHSIYDKHAEAKKVKYKAKLDKLKAEEEYIDKIRLELWHEIND